MRGWGRWEVVRILEVHQDACHTEIEEVDSLAGPIALDAIEVEALQAVANTLATCRVVVDCNIAGVEDRMGL